VKGVRKGDFTKIVAPPPCTTEWLGSVLCLTIPKPLTPQEIEQRRKAEQQRER
jgi:hypothetical protein